MELPPPYTTNPPAMGTHRTPDGAGTICPRPPHPTRDLWDSCMGEDHG